MIITDVAIEMLDVTPVESKGSDRSRTYVSFFSQDCFVLNAEIVTNAALLWSKHNILCAAMATEVIYNEGFLFTLPLCNITKPLQLRPTNFQLKRKTEEILT